jgi:hypothetical protein
VGVLAYEQMIADPDRFAGALAGLCGLPTACVAERIRSLPRTKTRAQLSDRGNPYLAKRENPAKQFTTADVEIPRSMDPERDRAVVSRCAAGNAALAARYDLDLAQLGYSVASGMESGSAPTSAAGR